MAQPSWYAQVRWSDPHTIAEINQDRGKYLPDEPGCYCFMLSVSPPRPGKVLYIGEAKRSLYDRITRAYLTKTITAKTIKPKGHLGGTLMYGARLYDDDGVKRNRDKEIYLRWVGYGGFVTELEASLIDYLKPRYNTRDEAARVGSLSDWETLDPRLIWNDRG